MIAVGSCFSQLLSLVDRSRLRERSSSIKRSGEPKGLSDGV
jgi:hypothetical protein